MADRGRRLAEREARCGDASSRAKALSARVRAGDLALEDLELAARLGCVEAASVVGARAGEDLVERASPSTVLGRRLYRGLSGLPTPRPVEAVAIAVGEEVLRRLETTKAKGPLPWVNHGRAIARQEIRWALERRWVGSSGFLVAAELSVILWRGPAPAERDVPFLEQLREDALCGLLLASDQVLAAFRRAGPRAACRVATAKALELLLGEGPWTIA